MGNKWVGLAINFVLALAVAVVFTAMLANSQGGNIGGLAALGSWSVLAQILLYIAFRMLADSESRFAAFLRVILSLAGGAIILTAGLIPSAAYTTGTGIPAGTSPWGYAFGGCWFLCGVLAFHLYYIACDNQWGGFWFAFMPLISLAASYILYVIFGYIGEAAGSFFTGWLGFILALAGAVFMIVRFVRSGSPFMGSLRESKLPVARPRRTTGTNGRAAVPPHRSMKRGRIPVRRAANGNCVPPSNLPCIVAKARSKREHTAKYGSIIQVQKFPVFRIQCA